MSIMFVTRAEAKTFLEIGDTVTEFDSLLDIYIKYISDRIQLFLNRKLSKESRTQIFQAGKRKYYVSAYPIDLTITPTVVLDDTTQDINDDYYVWSDEGLFEFDYKTTYIEPKQLSITYTGGYATTITTTSGGSEDIYLYDIPDSIKLACLMQVSFVFKRRNDIGLNSVSMPNGSIANMGSGSDLLPEVKNILKAYRKAAMEY